MRKRAIWGRALRNPVSDRKFVRVSVVVVPDLVWGEKRVVTVG